MRACLTKLAKRKYWECRVSCIYMCIVFCCVFAAWCNATNHNFLYLVDFIWLNWYFTFIIRSFPNLPDYQFQWQLEFTCFITLIAIAYYKSMASPFNRYSVLVMRPLEMGRLYGLQYCCLHLSLELLIQTTSHSTLQALGSAINPPSVKLISWTVVEKIWDMHTMK